MKKSRLLGALSACVLVFLTTTTNATVLPLQGRLPLTLGGTDYQAYYDPNLDITWAADAGISFFGTWDDQIAWVASLTIGGVSGWRLPSADVNGDGIVVDCFGGGVAGCEDNEMGFLYWEVGISGETPAPFSNVQTEYYEDIYYWYGTEYAPRTTSAYIFFFAFGGLGGDCDKFGCPYTHYAWAVHDGDVGEAVIPIPATIWLFGSGLLGLVGIAKCMKVA